MGYTYGIYGCVWKCCVPLKPMVNDGYIPMKNGYFIGNINPTFSDKPICAALQPAQIAEASNYVRAYLFIVFTLRVVQFCIKVWSCWQLTKTWLFFWHIFTLFLSPSSRKRSETDCLTLAHTGTRFNPDPRCEAGLAVLGVSRNSTGVSLVQFSNLSAASATANDCNGGGLILGWHRHRTPFWMKVKGNIKGNIRKYIKLNMDQ